MSPLKRELRAVIRRLGYDVRRYTAHNFPDVKRRELVLRHAIDLAIDGGAHDGGWAAAIRSDGYRGPIVAFEPDSSPFESLERRFGGDRRWRGFRCALGAEDTRAAFHVAASSSTSSLLQPRHDAVAVEPGLATVRVDEVEVRRLDSIDSPELTAASSILLKLDVQGHELAALEGARKTLERCSLIEAELSFAPIYAGQPLFGEIVEHLGVRDFVVAALEPVFFDEKTGALLQVNALFVRT